MGLPIFPIIQNMSFYTDLLLITCLIFFTYHLTQRDAQIHIYQQIFAENNLHCMNRDTFNKRVINLQTIDEQKYGLIQHEILLNPLFFQNYTTADICLPKSTMDSITDLWDLFEMKRKMSLETVAEMEQVKHLASIINKTTGESTTKITYPFKPKN